jgi:uncharacterized protein (UPF0264 family)
VKILISPVSRAEAIAVCDGGADIVDIKNTSEGSLGANFPWVIREVVQALKDRHVTFSATLGDLPFKPGTAALAALGAAHAGARYIKAGLYGTANFEEALEVMAAVARACRDYDPAITVVCAGYADWRRFGGLDPETLIEVAAVSQSDVVMVDTAIKDGASLFDAMTNAEIGAFVDGGHARGLEVALAGSIRHEHIAALRAFKADIIGVRGAVCDGSDRMRGITAARVRVFVDAVRAEAALV